MGSSIRALMVLALFVLAIGACASKPEYSRDGWYAIYGPGGGAGRD
jgi:hypothetical protein